MYNYDLLFDRAQNMLSQKMGFIKLKIKTKQTKNKVGGGSFQASV